MMMLYQTSAPHESLRNYVECFWIGEIDSLPTKKTFTYVATAQSKSEMLFHYRGNFKISDKSRDSYFSSGIYGQTNSHKQIISTETKLGIFGVRLFPHALPNLFNVPASELTNEMVDLDTLLGIEGRELTEQIFNACSFEEKIGIVTRFLQLRIRHRQSRYEAVEHAIARIHHTKGRVDYLELLKNSYHSQRQFERNFKERAGFSLQSYLKIVRFEAVMEHFPHGRPLTDVALDYGYYDQSHFNNDFKKFSGLSPSQYLELLKENYLI